MKNPILYVAILALLLGIFNIINSRKERRNLDEIIRARNPNLEYLDPIILPVDKSYRIIIPIRNSSRSELAIANRVQVNFSFRPDNKKISR